MASSSIVRVISQTSRNTRYAATDFTSFLVEVCSHSQLPRIGEFEKGAEM